MNKIKLTAAAISLSLLVATQASADGLAGGSASAGKDKAVSCGACHGADGNSVNPAWPSLAGQSSVYIVNQLKAFRKGSRSNVLMNAQVLSLTDEDMTDLAAYFSEQPAAPRAVADASLVDKGQALYRGGIKKEGVPACMACHGPNGAGNPAASYPSLSGQYATYTTAQLKAYANGERESDGATRVMRDIAKSLDDDDIAAVASYIQGLH